MRIVLTAMKLIRLLRISFSMSLRQALAFRVNLIFDTVMAVVALLSTFAAVLIIFSRTDTLAGWTKPEMFVLIGTFELLSGIKATFVDPNLASFPARGIREGRLDHHLLQPAPSMFLVSLSTATPLAGVQIPLGLAVVGVSVSTGDRLPGPGPAIAWLLLVCAATVTMWALGMLFASLAFWASKLDLHSLFSNAWQLARYPADIYAKPLRLLFTYVIPLALIATVPTRVLIRPVDPHAVLVALATSVVAVLLATVTWRQGLKRYTGATS
ncbi:ABC transporter permease [Streptomyces sp. NPDC088725]|uniref:ABC transporter permease n=1 Tax=Streptomyces sp. NPDC088725 TaxID=3365873 RepID=UPI003809BFC1